jgi:ATP-dependent protease ClpP protease subunit
MTINNAEHQPSKRRKVAVSKSSIINPNYSVISDLEKSNMRTCIGVKKKVKKNMSKKLKLKYLLRRYKLSEEDSEEDDSDMDSDAESNSYSECGGVYSHNNHIYFKTDVTSKSVDALIKIINQKNRVIFDLKKIDMIKNIKPNPLYLHLSSFGGSLFAGLIAVDAIKNSTIPIYTVIDGYAASAASLMSVVGKKRYMSNHAYVLIHQLSSGASGTFEQLKDFQTNNENIMSDMKKIYMQNTNISQELLDDALKHDLWWRLDKCIELGIVDEVYHNQC